MTREEAIYRLKNMAWLYGSAEREQNIEAIDMAIEALTSQIEVVQQNIKDAPSAEAVSQSEQYKKGFEDAKRAFEIEYARESENMRRRNAQLEVMLNAQNAILTDAVQGFRGGKIPQNEIGDIEMGNKYIMRNCYWCNEYQDMNATVPTCDYYGQYGSCPCSDECEHYISEPEVENIIRKRVETGHSHEDGQWFDLTDALAVKRTEWIPVSERLPKARESVILSTKEWTGEGCYWETTKNHVIWKGYRWNATYWDNEVIAWMPLPKPWKGADDETD